MSIKFEPRKRQTKDLAGLFTLGDWVVRCDICEEPITGRGNVEIAKDGRWWTTHKSGCSFEFAQTVRREVWTEWQDLDDMLRALASRYCDACDERTPKAVVS